MIGNEIGIEPGFEHVTGTQKPNERPGAHRRPDKIISWGLDD